MKVFKKAGRIPTIFPDGSRGHVQVKKGDCPEDHKLDLKRLDPGLLEEGPTSTPDKKPVGKKEGK